VVDIMRTEVSSFLEEYVSQFKILGIKDIDSLILFGSQARGTATISSDIDIAVVMAENLSVFERGRLLSLGDDVDMRFETNLFFTTRKALDSANRDLDTNKYIRDEGVVLWQP